MNCVTEAVISNDNEIVAPVNNLFTKNISEVDEAIAQLNRLISSINYFNKNKIQLDDQEIIAFESAR